MARLPIVGPRFTTAWRLVSQSHGAVAWRFWSPFPSHVPFPYATSCHRPILSVPWTPCPTLLLRGPIPSLIPCLYPTGRQQPWGAGPLDPHPSGDRFVRLARVAPFPPPPLSLCRVLGLFPASHTVSVPWGRRVALATRPFLSPPFSLHPVFLYTGPPATLWRGPTGSAAFPGPVHVPCTGRPLPGPFCLCGVLPSGPVVGPSSWPPRPPLPVPFPNLVTRRCCYCSLLLLFFFPFLFFGATHGLLSVLLLRPVPPPPARLVPHAP